MQCGGDEMKIMGSTISMTSKHEFVQKYSKEERLLTWVGKRPEEPKENNKLPKAVSTILEISEQARKKLEESMAAKTAEAEDVLEFEMSESDKYNMMILKAMLEKLIGKKINFSNCDMKKINTKAFQLPQNYKDIAKGGVNNEPVNQPKGWGIEYDLKESFYQKETMSFNADGIVKTADGREISFNVNLNMTKEFAEYNEINFRAGDAVKVDPLIVNYGNNIPSLTDKKFEFDLDMDGKADQIAFAGKGSGFLALDLNNDGKINDGSELFGPSSGNGFSELAKYDLDGNGWIDENDDVFDKLLIWSKDKDGNDQLYTLKEKNVGAIYLGNIATPFGYTGAGNELLGSAERSGIFLKETGQAGVIQHVDLVV